MRLIHTTTYAIEEFFGDAIPRYAILSHTWEDGEVSYQDWLSAPRQKEIRARAGYRKIIEACKQAFGFNCDWIWVDTSCIDKTNSTELFEALNSMYHWYGSAGVCLAYLADVPTSPCQIKRDEGKPFRDSRWFTRGWTLQELIAPSDVMFFSGSWDFVGSRASLSKEIQEASGIDPICLETFAPVNLKQFSVAKRMSWASKRTTTRIEDRAYCLLGIFGVSMPLLYGEGERAFIRLQEEIQRREPDLSILAWKEPGGYCLERTLRSPPLSVAFAPTPAAFTHSSDFVYDVDLDPDIEGDVNSNGTNNYGSSNVSSFGLSIYVRLIETLCPNFALCALSCYPVEDRFSTVTWMPLFQPSATRPHLWVRSLWPAATILFHSEHPLVQDTEKRPPATRVFIEAYNVSRYIDRLGLKPIEAPDNTIRLMPTGAEERITLDVVTLLVAFPAGMGPYSLGKTSHLKYDPQTDCAFPLTPGKGWPGNFVRGYLTFQSPGKDNVSVFFVVQLAEGIQVPSKWTCRVCPAMTAMPTLSNFTAAGEEWRTSDQGEVCSVVMGDTVYPGERGPSSNPTPHHTMIANIFFTCDEDDGGLSDSWVKVERPLSSPT